MRLRIGLLVAALGVAAPLQAQVYLAPNVGLDFGGDTNNDSKVSYGGTLTFAGNLVGFAVDFTYAPDFFPGNLRDNNVTTLMGNLVLLSPGRTRIYGSVGIGLMKTRVRSADDFFDIDSNELGLDVGGGILFVPDRVGFQADIRYFRSLTDPDPDGEFDIDLGGFNYWRASGGLVFRF
jgi:outer membrane protein with beta-barrel domain